MKNLRAVSNIPADKGNATVRMVVIIYEEKMATIVDDENTYKVLKRDPTTRVENTVADVVKRQYKLGHISVELKDRLIPSYSNPPQMYGLPKVHKPDLPLRPIVSSLEAPTYNLAKEMARILTPLAGNTDSYVKNSIEFADRIRKMELDGDDRLVSFDVVSLFTKVPVDIALDMIANPLRKDEHLQYLSMILFP